MEILALELRKLGLKEKQVQVYLAGLELGPTSVQNIARKTKISRPTTYEIIKSLEQKKLFIETKQGKKRYFSAQSPTRILGILRTQKKVIEEKEREFIRIVAALESKYSFKEKSIIRVYKGKEAVKTLLEQTLCLCSSKDIFLFSSKIDTAEIEKREKIYIEIKKRLGEIDVKEIYPKKLKTKPRISEIQRKAFTFNLEGTLILFDKAIFLPKNKTKPQGFLIESKPIVDLLKSFFLTLWSLI